MHRELYLRIARRVKTLQTPTPRRGPRRAVAWLSSTLALAAGCDSPTPRRPPAPPPRPAAPRVEGSGPPAEGPAAALDAGVPEVVARCVARARGSTPDTLRAALELLDEPALLDAACRLELAPRLHAPELCDGASLSSLRDACVSRAAMAAGAPDRCPPASGARVRDPVCVAVAARDRALCAAASSSDRPRCEAVAAGDPRRCGRLDPLLRGPCERDVRAMRGLIPTVRAVTDAASRPSTAALRCGDDAGVWALSFARRGVYLDAASRLIAVPLDGRWPPPWLAGQDEPVFALRAPLAGARPRARVRAEAVLILPGLGAMRTDDGTLDAEVTVVAAPRGRGGRARLEVALRGSSTGLARRCTLTLDAFVRDLVPEGSFVHPLPR
ncbi:MAG: hypothetical protein R3A48_20365 [Polyangiales bacterium]